MMLGKRGQILQERGLWVARICLWAPCQRQRHSPGQVLELRLLLQHECNIGWGLPRTEPQVVYPFGPLSCMRLPIQQDLLSLKEVSCLQVLEAACGSGGWVNDLMDPLIQGKSNALIMLQKVTSMQLNADTLYLRASIPCILGYRSTFCHRRSQCWSLQGAACDVLLTSADVGGPTSALVLRSHHVNSSGRRGHSSSKSDPPHFAWPCFSSQPPLLLPDTLCCLSDNPCRRLPDHQDHEVTVKCCQAWDKAAVIT